MERYLLTIFQIKNFFAGSSICATMLLSGCVTLQLDERNPHINVQSIGENTSVSRAHYASKLGCTTSTQTKTENEIETERCAYPMFVGVAISGGGLRAANFSLGVMAQLRNFGLFDEVTALSSVSGGSLAAAAVSLNPMASATDFDLMSAQLRTDYFSSWVYRSAKPGNFVPTLISGKNATRTLADVFDAGIYKGAVYGDLGQRKPGKPSLYINSSHTLRFLGADTLTTRGFNASEASLQGFTFTDAAFKEIGSDLNQLRVADAVAASAAYPGLFVPLTLKNFSTDNDTHPQSSPKYLHLYDAGSSDNLGVDALIRAYSEILVGTQDLSCLLILVDAHVNDRGDLSGSLADTRSSFIDYVISPTIYRAFDSLLEQRREWQLDMFGVPLTSDEPYRFNPNVNIPLKNYAISGAGTSPARGSHSATDGASILAAGRSINHANCAVWHISLARLLELTKKGNLRKRNKFFQKTAADEYKDESPRDMQIIKLDRFVSAIQTNFMLALNGPGHCEEIPIQNSLFEAARLLMTTDTDSSTKLVTWLKQNHRENLSQNLSNLLASKVMQGQKGMVHVPRYSVQEPNSSNPLGSWINCNK